MAPGFIDPHGHSDGSLFVDGALASHLHQGYTTQLSGNCGDTLAPITDPGRELVELALRPNGLVARGGGTFAEYLDRVEEQPLGPNVAFLVGHGTVRGSVMGAEARARDRRRAVRRWSARSRPPSTPARSGCRPGSIYAPGMHAAPAEVEALVTAAARRGGLYATHMRNESDGLFASLDESIAAVRAAGCGRARLQVSHLKCGAQAVWGRAGEAIARLEAARAEGLDVAADQYPYTAAATTLATILPPALRRSASTPAWRPSPTRTSATSSGREMERGISGWENVAADPGWPGLRISYAASHPEWAGRSLAELADELHAEPSDLAFDALVADRLDVSVVIECMTEPDVETIMAVPWIAVCTDAEGRRPGPPDPGRRPAAPAHVRQHGPGPRALRARARHPVARDGGREADLRPGRAARSPRSGRRPRGRRGRSRRVRCRDRRRRGDLRRTRALPDRHRPRRSSTAGRRSSTAPRPASAPAGCCGGPDRRAT